ncbi:MAG: TonB-dependent receptor, partial [Novosphingobium sp.]
LTDVPIAITALSGDQLAAAGAQDITAVAETVPNVTLEPSRGSNSTLTAFIRGVGQQDPVSGFEQGVGIYLDDVYLNRPQAAVLDIYDVQRIEVLRGPQGTLYGRNTVGGAIKYVTRRLDDQFRVSARATYGSYNQADGVLSMSTPIGTGVVRVGGAVARLTRDGFGKNLTTGLDNYDKDVWAARGTIEVHATDFFARLSGDYTLDKSNPRGGHRLIPGLLGGAPVLANVYDTRGGLNDPKQRVEAYGGSLFMEATPNDWLTFRSITAVRRDDSATPIDFDALPAADVDVPGYYFNRQLSQELQVLVDAGPLKGLVGMYYLNASALTQFDVRLFTNAAGFPGLTAFTNADIGTDTIAAFADFTYDFSDQLSLSLGGRYTWDKRTGYILRQNYLLGGSPVFGGAGTAFGAPSTNFRGSETFKKFTPKATLSFKPNPDTTLYASYSQGFKGGGFDPRGVGNNAPDLNRDGVRSDAEIADFLSFSPETVNSYEVGAKADLLDRRVYLAMAAFHMDYTDVQIPGSVACVSGGVPTFCGVVSNAGKARLRGFELETRAKLIDTDSSSLTFTGSLGYIDAKYKTYITNIGGVPTDVAAFRKIQNTPAWTGSASLDYGMAVGDGRLNLTAGMSFKSRTYQVEIPIPQIDQPAYQLVDASIVYRAPDNRWTLGVYGKNLTNERVKTSGYNF